ncbi:hypothetical protein M408DRAFT_257465 [Serendipita vermifera MAFF 305830]|uniref:Uncharacterized protein n=1 Tax=Serendipita vermifera MAFF 305830 TaxID=933852 RepID=A0A0C2WZ02_SERVB|nr:hypothetical protein M408DRAFT_257465 [Serendipita vermifera MAFF 305830]
MDPLISPPRQRHPLCPRLSIRRRSLRRSRSPLLAEPWPNTDSVVARTGQAVLNVCLVRHASTVTITIRNASRVSTRCFLAFERYTYDYQIPNSIQLSIQGASMRISAVRSLPEAIKDIPVQSVSLMTVRGLT